VLQVLTVGRVVTAVFMVALAGCGGTAMVGVRGASEPAATTASPVAPTLAPQAGIHATTPTPVSTPVPTTHRPAPMTFAIRPLFAAGAAGAITVLLTDGVAHYHGVVTGLMPGSVHTIHDHAGACGASLSSRHLAFLITATADSRGVLVFDAAVPASDFGAGRIVLVYQSARATVIAGCAAL
jgi:hypothetical protein